MCPSDGFGARCMPGRATPAACAGLLPLLGACDDNAPPPPPEIRPVRTVTVAPRSGGDSVSLTGTVEAQTEVEPRLPHRRPHGRAPRQCRRPRRAPARCSRGWIRRTSRTARRRAPACRAPGPAAEARNNIQRQRDLLGDAASPRAPSFEQAPQARAAPNSARSRPPGAGQASRRTGLSFTELHADAEGVVTAVGAEPGEVVQAGRMIVRLARQDGRDAVFDVPAQVIRTAPADPEITGLPDRGAERHGRRPRARGRGRRPTR